MLLCVLLLLLLPTFAVPGAEIRRFIKFGCCRTEENCSNKSLLLLNLVVLVDVDVDDDDAAAVIWRVFLV